MTLALPYEFLPILSASYVQSRTAACKDGVRQQ
jgi:hypothetical protein